jgi:hypothetical protein
MKKVYTNTALSTFLSINSAMGNWAQPVVKLIYQVGGNIFQVPLLQAAEIKTSFNWQ